MIMDDRGMYDEKKNNDRIRVGAYLGYTVSCSYRDIIWVSTVEYRGLPERNKSQKVFS